MASINIPSLPAHEQQRAFKLAEFNLDYADLNETFRDLNILAAKISGTSTSVVNLIDTYTQWTVSSNDNTITQWPKEETICQHVIAEGEDLEIKDLSADPEYQNLGFVKGNKDLKYYYGMPLQTSDGYHIGAFCVLDKKANQLTDEQVLMLKIIAQEVVNRLESIRTINSLKEQLKEANVVNKRAAHDIRGPLGGVIGVTNEILNDDGMEKEELHELVGLVHDSCQSLITLSEEILIRNTYKEETISLADLKGNFEKLYAGQAKNKNIGFKVKLGEQKELSRLSKTHLLQIIGNVVSNALKFTSEGGEVVLELDLQQEADYNLLIAKISDTGVGIDEDKLAALKSGACKSSDGTAGEVGFGIGLNVVVQLLEKINGSLDISSVKGSGSTFTISVPMAQY